MESAVRALGSVNSVARPLVFSIPHSGELLPQETPWLAKLPETLLMFDVDRYVDQLYSSIINSLSIPTVICPWHRYAVDLNRLPDDVDQDSVKGHSNRSGLFPRGLHWSITTAGEKLMPGPMTAATHQQILGKYFDPFHKEIRETHGALRQRLSDKRVFHLDLHSMPSVGTKEHRDPGQVRPDVVISDSKGTAATRGFRDLVVGAYEAAGLKVGINWPYFGGRITEIYGKPESNPATEVVQVELNRALYMDEKTKQLVPEKANQLIRQLELAIEELHSRLPVI